MPIIFQSFIKREDLRSNPNVYYVFGDNDHRVGTGGQAKEMRGEPNALGIRTKKAPTYNISDFYTDNEYADNVNKIEDDIFEIKQKLWEGAIVVLPLEGVGTGRANLQVNAPLTLEFIKRRLNTLIEDYGIQ